MELTKVYFLHLGIEIRPNFNVLPIDHWTYIVCPIELMISGSVQFPWYLNQSGKLGTQALFVGQKYQH